MGYSPYTKPGQKPCGTKGPGHVPLPFSVPPHIFLHVRIYVQDCVMLLDLIGYLFTLKFLFSHLFEVGLGVAVVEFVQWIFGVGR